MPQARGPCCWTRRSARPGWIGRYLTTQRDLNQVRADLEALYERLPYSM
ncbi:hypothetical protein [Streptomyces sp. NPDC047725]